VGHRGQQQTEAEPKFEAEPIGHGRRLAWLLFAAKNVLKAKRRCCCYADDNLSAAEKYHILASSNDSISCGCDELNF
jgi:hypothetical protein